MDEVKLSELKASISDFEEWCKTVQTIPNAIVIGEAALRVLLENTLLDRSESSVRESSAGRCLAVAATDSSLGYLVGLPFYIDRYMISNQIKIGIMTFYHGMPDFHTLQVITV
jgi:hypothetical protein